VTCKENGCERPRLYSSGLCGAHYKREMRRMQGLIRRDRFLKCPEVSEVNRLLRAWGR
jgi:hypothetical protein